MAAEAEAEANAKIAASLTEGLLQYHQLSQWDGALPSVTGSGEVFPVIDIGGDAQNVPEE